LDIQEVAVVAVAVPPVALPRLAARAAEPVTMLAAAAAAEHPTTASTPALAETAATASWSW